jgi:Histidine kinase-like ATPase domain
VPFRSRRRVSITIQDEVQGFDTGTLLDPTVPENRLRTSGRGIYLMKALMDEVRFEKSGALVYMRKTPRPARPEETPQSPAVTRGSPAPCSGCGVGFITWTAYIHEDTIDGHMDASIDPGAKGWSVSDQGVFWGLNSATLVVREAP